MRKIFSKTLIFGLVFTVTLAATVCCKFAIAAQTKSCHVAAKQTTKTSPCSRCQPGTKTSSTDTCCIKQLPADQLTKISLNISSSVDKYIGLVLLPRSATPPSAKFNLVHLQSPANSIDVPLYLYYRSFRI